MEINERQRSSEKISKPTGCPPITQHKVDPQDCLQTEPEDNSTYTNRPQYRFFGKDKK
ncbi:MAG: hypothetical protein ACLVAW_21645 [Eisenbergiella massiliensis]